MRIALCLILVLAAAAALAAEPAGKLDAKAVQAKLKGEWREFDVRVPRDKQFRESFGIQWSMFQPADPTAPPNQTSLTDHDNESTQTHGVLILNTEADPMWLDFRFPDEAGEMLQVGILRFEKDQPR